MMVITRKTGIVFYLFILLKAAQSFFMNLLYLSTAPGLAIILYVYHKDKYNREPVMYLITSFCLGVFSALPAVYIEMYGNAILNQFVEVSLLHTLIMAFIVVA